MAELIREPQQKRSIDKKNRIINAGYELFATAGYFSTNTVEIAKKAGVSTGIVYGYFHDKRDILLEVLNLYIANVFAPIFDMFDQLKSLDFEFIVPHIIDKTVETHIRNAAMHETLHSLSHTDEAVYNRFIQLENDITRRLADKLVLLGYDKPDTAERVHLAMETVQSYAHEAAFDKHDYLDYAKMRGIVIKMLTAMLQ